MAARIMMSVGGRAQPLALTSGPISPPSLNSAATNWAGLPLEIHSLGPVDSNRTSGPLSGEYGLLVVLSGQVDVALRRGSREMRICGVPGAMSTLSGDCPAHIVEIVGTAEAAAVHVPGDWFRRLLLDSPPAAFGLTQPMVRDETVFSLVSAMRNEVAGGSLSGRLFAESISTALLSYIVERLPASSFRARGRLSDAQCARLQRYIRDHLDEDLSLMDLARVASLSPRHFSTLFRQAFGTTPYQYVVRSRLVEGARLLATEYQDIAEVALRLGFSSQSHFTAAFRRAFGVTPGRYAAAKRKSICVGGQRRSPDMQ